MDRDQNKKDLECLQGFGLSPEGNQEPLQSRKQEREVVTSIPLPS